MLAALLDTRLIRLQCYEGIDVSTAVYEWNYTRQMLHIRLIETRAPRIVRSNKKPKRSLVLSSDATPSVPGHRSVSLHTTRALD